MCKSIVGACELHAVKRDNANVTVTRVKYFNLLSSSSSSVSKYIQSVKKA